MDATDISTARNPLSSLTKVPIAQLSPTLEQVEEKYIFTTVSLVWPYSSSTKSLSLSLAEPDYRLRRSNGQVKAIFHGRVAQKVAESHVGIGDTVRLALKGADFAANDAATQTPGRNIAWDLHFDTGVSVEINRASKNSSTVIIEQSPLTPHDTEQHPPSTPRVMSIDPVSDTAHEPGSWLSPAFARLIQSPFKVARDSSFDPFADEDGSIPGKGRKRPRYSFQRHEWRIAESSATSREEELEDQETEWEKELEDEMNTEEDLETTPKVGHEDGAAAPEYQDNIRTPLQGHSPVFVKPSLDVSGSTFGRRAPQSNMAPTGPTETALQRRFGAASHLPTDTPQLLPVPSPGLPIPSPIVSNNNNAREYFSPFHTQQQAQTIQSIVTGTDADIAPLAQSPVGSISPISQSQVTTAPAEQLETTQLENPVPSPSRTMLEDQGSPLERAGPNELAGHSNEQPTESTESFNAPTFQEVREFSKPDNEMRDAGVDHMMPAAEPVGRQPDETDQLEEATDVEKDVLHQAPETAVEDEGPDVEAVQETQVQADHVHGEVAANDARAVVDMETVEDELEEHTPEAFESEDEAMETSLPAADRSRSRSDSEDGYSEESDEEDEALYDENDAADSMLEDDDDEGDYDDGDEHSRDPHAGQLPRPLQTQPEVIVLDSDSEDELASDQPTGTPSQPAQQENRYHRESFIESRVADFAAEEEGELDGEEEDDYESDSDVTEDRDQPENDERVHDSDSEDVSSEEASARDRYINQYSSREDFVEEESIREEHDDGGLGVETEELRANQDNFDARETQGSVIRLYSDEEEEEDEEEDEDEDEDEEEDKGEDEGEDEREHEEGQDDQRASPEEPESSDHVNIALHSLDGVNDQATMQSPVGADEDQEDTLVDGIPPGDIAKQLTPHPTHPTHDATSGPQSTRSEDRMVILPAHEKPGQSLGLNIASMPSLDAASSAGEVTSIEDFMSPEHPSTEARPNTLHTQPHQDGTDDVDVAVPTTEHAEIGRNITKTSDHDTAPEPSMVRVNKPLVPNRHAHGLRSKLSYFAPLAALIDHYNALVDTISIVYEATPIAKGSSGSRDYFMTIQLTDPSMAGTILQAQIFRPTKSAMPSLAEGNALLLRDFKVRSYDHSIMLVSVESSSWAVFDGSAPEAQMSGPPVEYGSEERAYASGLRRWYTEVGTALVADHQLQASIERDSMDRGVTPSDVAISEAGSLDSGIRGDSISSARGSRRSRRSTRRVTIHELRDGTRYTEVGSPRGRGSIHELRDGTVYADL